MKLIKNAICYKVNLPGTSALEGHLAEFKYNPIGTHEISTAGFEPLFDDSLVLPFSGGYAFRLRYDEKIIPSASVKQKTKERIAELEAHGGRALSKNEKAAIKDRVFSDMIPVALVKTSYITCFYHAEDKRLIVPTTSKKLAGVVTTKLLKAVGSIKAETIYLDGIKQSLTAKLSAYVNGDESVFEGFDVGGYVKLTNGERKISIDGGVLEQKEGLIEAFSAGLGVIELRLFNADVMFTINDKYTLKKVVFSASEEYQEEFEDERAEFCNAAFYQVSLFAHANRYLLKLFEYKETDDLV
jgi:recombination associated protein RdgC